MKKIGDIKVMIKPIGTPQITKSIGRFILFKRKIEIRIKQK